MIRNILLASVLALGAAGAAQAADGPRLVGGLANGGARVERSAPASLVGGGTVALTGGGDDRSYAYGVVNEQPGRIGRLVGGGDEAQVIYDDAAPASGIATARGGVPRG